MIREALLDNRDQLIAQNMLENGHSKKEAEGEVDLLLGLLQLFGTARGQLSFDERVQLKMNVNLANAPDGVSESSRSTNGAKSR